MNCNEESNLIFDVWWLTAFKPHNSSFTLCSPSGQSHTVAWLLSPLAQQPVQIMQAMQGLWEILHQAKPKHYERWAGVLSPLFEVIFRPALNATLLFPERHMSLSILFISQWWICGICAYLDISIWTKFWLGWSILLLWSGYNRNIVHQMLFY